MTTSRSKKSEFRRFFSNDRKRETKRQSANFDGESVLSVTFKDDFALGPNKKFHGQK